MSTTKDTFQNTEPTTAGTDTADIEAMEAVLDDLRSRDDEVPQWEFCEGFMTALIVCRRRLEPAQYLPVLLDMDEDDGSAEGFQAPFVSVQQQQQFMDVWLRRWSEIETALGQDIEDLGDERAWHPWLADVRGAVLQLPEAERAAFADQALPSHAQIWALGFMYMVETWPEEWAAPRDRETRKTLEAAMQCILDLTEDDTGLPTIAVYDDNDPPSVSQERMEALARALWAGYEMYAVWKSIGPRVETVHSAPTPGRNDPCHCGSGKKFKKCHGS